MLPSAAFPLKEFGKFIKKNNADFSNLPHDSFKPWPSSALCSARVRASCQPLCTTTLPKQISTFWASLSLQRVPYPRDRRKANNCYTAKSPQVCEHSEWLSHKACIWYRKSAGFKHTQWTILTAPWALPCMSTVPEARHHPAQVNIDNRAQDYAHVRKHSSRKQWGNRNEINPKVQQLSEQSLEYHLVSTEFMVPEI